MIGFSKTKPMQKRSNQKTLLDLNYLQSSDLEANKLHQVCAYFKN
jgi:hypothetical protein